MCNTITITVRDSNIYQTYFIFQMTVVKISRYITFESIKNNEKCVLLTESIEINRKRPISILKFLLK